MSRVFLFIAMLALLSCSDGEYDIDVNKKGTVPGDTISNSEQSLLQNKKWSCFTIPSGTLWAGQIQGAAIYNGIMYQFRNSTVDGKSRITYDLYDINKSSWTKGDKVITCVPNCHAGSACFSPNVVPYYSMGDSTFTCTSPFVFLTGHYSVTLGEKTSRYEVIDVVDIDNDHLVRRYTFPNKTDDVIASYDFANNRVWLFGYNDKVSGMSAYIVDEYTVDLTSLYPEKTMFKSDDVTSSYSIGGPNTLGFQENTSNGTLQDACFNNGYVYIAVGRGSNYNRTEWAKVHAYDTNSHKIVNTLVSTDYTEPEGFVFDGKDFYMTANGRNLWKLSDQSGYDNKYNFEPATEVATDSFSISNASQLVWFKSQVYNGRSYIKGALTADIDMSQVADPYTFYIYDTNIADGQGTEGRKYESYYAFRGTFDGQGHIINNVNITSTPYYNDGVLPYIAGATIKNVTVNGRIKLTPATHDKADSCDVQNVGFIGYMNGGTLENIDVTGLTIDMSGVSKYMNISSLVGSENGVIYKTNCTAQPNKQ